MTDKKSIDSIEKELKEYYRDIQNIKAPDKLEEVLLTNIRGIKPRKKYRGLLVASIIIAFFGTTVAFYPAIADTVVDLLKFKKSVSNSNDIGLKKVFESELGKGIYIQNSNKDMLITLQRAYRDKHRIIVLATVKFNNTDKINQKILAFDGTITDENGESLYSSYIMKTDDNYDKNTNSTLLEFQFTDIENLGQRVTLTIEEHSSLADDLDHWLSEDENGNEANAPKVQEGLDTRDELQKVEIPDENIKNADNSSKEDVVTCDLSSLDSNTNILAIDINKEVDMGGFKVSFKKLEVKPSDMRLYYGYDSRYVFPDTQEYQAMTFWIPDLIVNGKEYSILDGESGESEEKLLQKIKSGEIIKRTVGYYIFNPPEGLNELNNIQDITVKIRDINKEIPVNLSIPLEKNAKACYVDEDGKKYNILVKSFEIEDDNLVIQYEFNGVSIGNLSILDGNNVYEIIRNTSSTTVEHAQNHIVDERQMFFPKPSRLTELKLKIESMEVMIHEDIDVKLK